LGKGKRLVTGVLVIALSVMGALAQEAKKQKQVKDQAEFDLLQLINKEAPSVKKIELLDQWKQKYPESEFKEDRAMVYVQTYQATNNGPKMWDACEELLAINPKSAPALFFLMSLGTSLNDPSKYDKGEGYTRRFLELLPELYAGKEGDAQAMKEKKSQEATGRKTLGQLAMLKKDYKKAEALYTEYLKWEPNSGNVSYALGNAMLLQKDKAKQIPALWHLARAAHYTGDDALPDASKKQLQAFFEKTYVNYHGSKEGMQEVLDAALKRAVPRTRLEDSQPAGSPGRQDGQDQGRESPALHVAPTQGRLDRTEYRRRILDLDAQGLRDAEVQGQGDFLQSSAETEGSDRGY
jgi:predicted Zn-dependent protease